MKFKKQRPRPSDGGENSENISEKKKKSPYSLASNLIWTFRNLLDHGRGLLLILILLVPVNVGVQYLEIYLPAAVAGEVLAGRQMGHALLAAGIPLLGLLLGDVMKQSFRSLEESARVTYQCENEELVIGKSVRMFYQIYEKKEVRDLKSRAMAAAQMWNGMVPLEDIARGGFGLVENLLGYALFGAVISFVSPWLTVFLTLAPLANLSAARVFQKWEYGHRGKMADLDQRLSYVNHLPGNFAGAKDIRIYSMASWLQECYRDLSGERKKWDEKIVRYGFLSRLVELAVILVRDGAAYLLLISMVLKGSISVEKFILYFAAISSFADWVSGIIESWNRMCESSLRVCDFREYMDWPDPEEGKAAPVPGSVCDGPEIVFDRVCFRYDNAERDAVHKLSLTIRKGEKLALVGDNGAGKTTLVKLLCGLYLPDSGQIRINGVPLSDFRREDYYRLIAPVFQDIRTGFFTLGETVSGKDMEHTDEERVRACLRRAGLGEKLETLPDGIGTRLGTQVNRDAVELSGGEAQKLMLARALYKDAPVLVLDEPTAALDPLAESRIYREYERMAENKTSLFISHRLSSTSFCDRIILLKEGEICEEGTHEELMKKGGIYRKLFSIQSCWYQEEGKEALS